jgi:chromosome segregation ATPase
MPEEEKKEPQKPPETPGGAPESNGASNAEDLAAIKAELEEEKKAKAAIEAAIAKKDTLIAALQTQLSEAKKGSEATATELTQVKEAQAKAVSKYLEVARLANPSLPPDVIAGSTIEEIDASLAKAKTIAESVKKVLEAQAKEAKVPAGAPTRGEISIEGLTPREKIAAGVAQKIT